METNYKVALKRIKEAKRKNSTTLDLSELELTQFLPEVLELTNLEVLEFRKNKLTSLPENIGKLTKLKEFDLSSNQITTVPEEIKKLSALTKLDLSINKLSILPKSILGLTNVTELVLGGNLFTTIPDDIGELAKLEQFYIEDGQLIKLPESIGNLHNLRRLGLIGNKLTSIPKSIGNLTNLNWLSVGRNRLTSIPQSIGKLNKLTSLYLHDNRLTNIPDALGELHRLSILALDTNQLTTLPETMEVMSKLKELDLFDNQFKVGAEIYKLPPLEQIQEILKWQRAQKAGTLQPINEAKIIFIGESNFGKTHLIEYLREGKIKRKIKTTHGIERSQITIPYKTKGIRLNIWDLGGQEFMRSTHQFFFSERSLYVLVTLARRERNELNHWLKLANQLGNRAPVLVVINKVDVDSHDLDRKSLERDYPNIIGFVRTSINDCNEGKASDSLKLLKDKIIEVVCDKGLMPGVFEERPPDWFSVKDELEKLETKGTDFITYEEYENLKFIKDLPDEDRKSNLKLLSMIGAVVSFVDDPRLIDTNVINPQWIMDGVYAIINDSEVKDKNKGRLDINALERILPKKKFPKARHSYLLELMKKFNLCYGAKDQPDIYFIPDLFEDIEPNFKWDSVASMHFRYNYDDFSPDAFMTRFIVEMHEDMIEDKRWRSGVFISNGSCQAKVYQTYRKNYIHVEVIGNKGEGRSYLYAIRETFRKLHKPFPQMHIAQEVLYKNHWLDYLQLVKLEAKGKPYYHIELEEDLPVSDILNGYSTPIERKGSQKHITIFLASSAELKEEREEFEVFIHRENQQFYKKGIYLELIIWENFIDAMAKTRLQDEYNNAIKHSDIFISLFFTKVGKYTKEEFETAFGQFKKTGKPKVYTYFKNAPIDAENITKEIKTLFTFRKKLDDLGHFRTIYNNMDHLKLQFKNQLEKILPDL